MFFFNDTATTEIYTLSLHDALPICLAERLEHFALDVRPRRRDDVVLALVEDQERVGAVVDSALQPPRGARQHVLLAPAEKAQVVFGVEEVLVALPARDQVVGEPLDDLPGGSALDDLLPALAGDDPRRADRVELAE